MRFSWKAALALSSLLVSPAVHAAPSLLGPVGYVLTPSADTLGARHYAFAVHHEPLWNLIGASYSHTDAVELGVTFLDPTRPGDRESHPSANAKVRVAREGRGMPAVSIGVNDAFGWLSEGPYCRSLYAVASRDFAVQGLKQPLRASLGGGTGLYKRGFGAVSVPVHAMGSLLLEYDGAYVNPGARVTLPRGFVLDVSSVRNKFGIGAAYGAQW